MKSILIYIGILMYLFITTSTAAAIGIKQVGLTSFGILLVLFLFEVIIRNKAILKLPLKEEYSVIAVFVSYSFLQILVKNYEPVQSFFFFIVAPIIASILLRLQDQSIKRNVCRLILFFFLAECALALYERTFKINVFPYQIKGANLIDEEDWQFRSSAFLGHPLTNAVAVSVILGYILVSRFSNFFKVFCLGCGFMALLCFNARGAIIVWGLFGLHYLYTIVRINNKSVLNKISIFLFVIAFISGAFYIVFYTSIGGRIVNQGKIVDGSALTRVNAYRAFDYLSGVDLWFGNPGNYITITNALHAGGIENSYIVIIINYGILIGVLLMISLIFLVKKYLILYSGTQKIILLMSFILVGSFNNSLASNTPWIIFLLCTNAFPFYGNIVVARFIQVSDKQENETIEAKNL